MEGAVDPNDAQPSRLRKRRLDGQQAPHQVDIAPGERESLGADPEAGVDPDEH